MPTSRTTKELERRLGRYLTAPELANVQQGRSSKSQQELTAQEIRALHRIWPGINLQYELNLGDRSERTETVSRRDNERRPR